MVMSLSKGENISLSKVDPSLKKVLVGLGWEPRVTDGQNFDLDASVFMLGANGKVRNQEDMIFYKRLQSVCQSILHKGDNQNGEGDGDDEQIMVDLEKVPADVSRLVITVTIHDAVVRGQNFGQVDNARVRLVNSDTDTEVVKFHLSEDQSTEIAMIFGEIYRHDGGWKFKAVGQGFAGGLLALCTHFGINATA